VASIQKKGKSWYCQFTYRGKRHTFTVGEVEEIDAKAKATKVRELLNLIKRHLLEVPADCDIVTFMEYDGKPPGHLPPPKKKTTFKELKESYLRTFGKGAVEESTLYTAKIHLTHVGGTLGEQFEMDGLTLADLQRHVDRRQDPAGGKKGVAGVTVKKEIDTLRAAWNWASRMGYVEGGFPSGRLVYPKEEEKFPFMTWEQIERRIHAGGDAGELWECLYLKAEETEDLLSFVKGRKRRSPWIYPMFLTAAHTGARRSELIRARVEDLDLGEGVLTIREKKRTRSRRTTRTVPLSSTLASVLAEWVTERRGLPYLFGPGQKPMSPQAAQHAIERMLKDSKWSVLKGWHVLRHSFISALASRGVDQRLIDEFVGHQTEEQRRRYRHLYPTTKKEAITLVFG
jgi:integrase